MRTVRLVALLSASSLGGIMLMSATDSPVLAQPTHAASHINGPTFTARKIFDTDKRCLPVSGSGLTGTICTMLHVNQHLRGIEFWPKVTFKSKSGPLSRVHIGRLFLYICDTVNQPPSCEPVNTETNVTGHPKAGSASAAIQGSKGYVPTPGAPISIGGAIAITSCMVSTSGHSACFPGWSCSTSTPHIACSTDPLIFAVSLAEFQKTRNAVCKGDLPDCDKKSGNSHGKHLDWSSDGCSLPMPVKKYGQNPFGWPYRLACERHDFGYRNYNQQRRCTNRPNGGTRKLLDQVFLADLRGICAHVKATRRCNSLALVYYNAVRRFGGCSGD